jgi:hypothetical protein
MVIVRVTPRLPPGVSGGYSPIDYALHEAAAHRPFLAFFSGEGKV